MLHGGVNGCLWVALMGLSKLVAMLQRKVRKTQGGMNGSEGSCGRRGWDSLEDFGDRPADAAKDRFGTKDDSRADVQMGEEGSKRLALRCRYGRVCCSHRGRTPGG